MSSIMRARSALTGRSEGWEVIGDPLELKVAGPSMLGVGSDASVVTPYRLLRRNKHRPVTRAPIPRELVCSWVGTGHLPCVANAPNGFHTRILAIASAAVSTRPAPASPWGAGRLFERRLGLGLGRHLGMRPQRAEQPRPLAMWPSLRGYNRAPARRTSLGH
jgi:hypothetical protein